MARRAHQIASSNLDLPDNTYIYCIAQESHTSAAISSDDTLTLIDRTTLKPVRRFPNAHRGITCLRLSNNYVHQSAVTAGRDGAIKMWDGQDVELQIDCPNAISALCVNGNQLIAGTEYTSEGLGDVSVFVWDIRHTTTPLREYKESHTDTITQLEVHPQSTSTLLSASTDGLVSIFDTSIADEDDALTQVFNHFAAVHCAGFISPSEVYAISTDEQMSIYTLGKSDDQEEDVLTVKMLGDIRDALKSTYMVDLVRGKSAWVASGDTSSQTLSLTKLDVGQGDWTFGQATSFPGAHGDEIVRDIKIDEENERIMTCGEDGHVRLWSIKDKIAKTKSTKLYKPY